MPKFRYSALRDSGERVTGVIEGSERSIVIGRLSEQGLHPIDVTLADQTTGSDGQFLSFADRVSKREIGLFARELAWLLQAGMTLNDGLDLLAGETFSKKFSAIVTELRTEIRKGRSFKDALRGTNAFPQYVSSMVEVGEASGTLATALERVAQSLDRERRLNGQIVSALLYPAILVCLASAAIVFIMISVVPSIKDMITSSGAPVPESAQFVIGLSDWLIANGKLLGITVALAVLGAYLLSGMPWFQSALQATTNRIPFVGSLLRKAAVTQFCRTLGTLTASGMNFADSLKLIGPSTPNRSIAAAIGDMEKALRRGDDFIMPLEKARVFPPLLSRMLKVGNETGNLTSSILQVADILDEELERAIERSLTLLGPLIILVLSIFVAFIITSLMSAIISINDLAL